MHSKLKRILLDPSLWLILGANILTIVQAARELWSTSDVFWAFWFQSILIGFFAAIRLYIGRRKDLAGFLVLHYGFFHLMYFFFLVEGSGLPSIEILLPSVGAFATAHATSAFYVYRNAINKYRDETAAFLRPYGRVIPMHMTIIIFQGAVSVPAILGLLGLKTLVDIGSHIALHAND